MKSSWEWLAALAFAVLLGFYTGIKIPTNPAISLGGFGASMLLPPALRLWLPERRLRIPQMGETAESPLPLHKSRPLADPDLSDRMTVHGRSRTAVRQQMEFVFLDDVEQASRVAVAQPES